MRPPRKAISTAGKSETVLCLDNDANILGGMTILLQGWGCEVLAAVDLAGAVAAVRGGTRAPSGLLVDYHLERSNGIEAIRALRRQLDPDLPAALITADRSAESATRPALWASPCSTSRSSRRRCARWSRNGRRGGSLPRSDCARSMARD